MTAHLLDHGGRQFREIALRTADWHTNPVRVLPDDAPKEKTT